MFPGLCCGSVTDARRFPGRSCFEPHALRTGQHLVHGTIPKRSAALCGGVSEPSPPRHVSNWGWNLEHDYDGTIDGVVARALSVLRIITGLMIIQHGMAKLLGFPAVASFANLSPFSLIGAAGFIELIGGALLIIGFLTQPVAFVISGEMAFAYFIAHAPKSFFPLINGGTLAIAFCFTCLYLATAGAGPWSIDATMKRA